MEDITKKQLFLLLLLVSIVTGVSTAIIVYTLVEQAPSPITHTFQRIIERAVEKKGADTPLPQEIVFDLEKAALARDTLIEDIAKRLSPAVVSVIATKDIPVVEQYFVDPFGDDDFFQRFFPELQIPQLRQKGTEKRQVSAGSGFFVSPDGYVITNRHVVEDPEAEYSVIMNNGKKVPTKVLARDVLQDIAILKVGGDGKFAFVPLGNSETVNIGQTAIAIGNALGEFQNTLSVGIISGLRRTIVAQGSRSGPEELPNVIQTDAAINPGNSGGPLLNLRGEAIGVNVAVAQGAENIGFAIPINQVKKALSDVQKTGKITYPFIGVRHVLVTADLQEKEKLPVPYGALILKGAQGEPGVTPGSPAEKAGLKEGDIILEFGGARITSENTLLGLIRTRNVGDTVALKVLRDDKELALTVTLEERK